MKLSTISLVAGIALALSACGASYDHDVAVQDTMDQGGIDKATAECIVDGMENEFGIDKLESNDDLTGEEEEIISQIAIDCLLGD